jgi:hypothetical protein
LKTYEAASAFILAIVIVAGFIALSGPCPDVAHAACYLTRPLTGP